VVQENLDLRLAVDVPDVLWDGIEVMDTIKKIDVYNAHYLKLHLRWVLPVAMIVIVEPMEVELVNAPFVPKVSFKTQKV
tara:strand:+ start:35 stop:271 length:237 start_codon:yes stop_codon:yes gene_type:complete